MDVTERAATTEAARPRIALFAKGFRPFFLLAALHATIVVPLWLVLQARPHRLEGGRLLPTVWHGHEMVFGFAIAVVAGFLLTAAASWTKRETATGPRLAALCSVWLAGRVAISAGSSLPAAWVAGIDLAFLPLLAFTVGRVVVLARSKRNYGIVIALLALWLAQIATHAGALFGSIYLQVTGPKIGVDLVVLLITIIGGRIIPLFTRNATKAEDIRSTPLWDKLAIASVAALTIVDALPVHRGFFAALASLGAVANAARAIHWGARHSRSEPLVWVLHAGWAFVPLGLALRALAVFVPALSDATALHALTVGAIGTMTLAMMVRVSLGHTGRPLEAPASLTVAFVLVIVAALARVIGPIVGGAATTPFMHAAGTALALAFAIYLVRIGPLLLRPRPDGRPG